VKCVAVLIGAPSPPSPPPASTPALQTHDSEKKNLPAAYPEVGRRITHHASLNGKIDGDHRSASADSPLKSKTTLKSKTRKGSSYTNLALPLSLYHVLTSPSQKTDDQKNSSEQASVKLDPPVAPQENDLYTLGVLFTGEQSSSDVVDAVTKAIIATHRFSLIDPSKLRATFTARDIDDISHGYINKDLFSDLRFEFLFVVSITALKGVCSPEQKPDSRWRIDATILDAKTANPVRTIHSGHSMSCSPLPEAIQSFYEQIRAAFTPLGYIVKIGKCDVTVNIGSDAGVKPGAILDIMQNKSLPTKAIGELKVVSASPTISTCKLVKVQGALIFGSPVRLQESEPSPTDWLPNTPNP
jgi:hypothetical protein